MSAENELKKYKASILSVQKAAKQLVTIVPLLQTAYFAAISMSDLKESIWHPSFQGDLWLLIPFVAPAILWMGSLILAILIFVPPLGSASAAKTPGFFCQQVNKKYKLLRFSYYGLVLGFLALLWAVLTYFLIIPPPSQSP